MSIKVTYDKMSDVLYISKHKGIEAIAFESLPGVMWRKSVSDGHVVGVTILDFDHYWKPRMASLLADLSAGLSISKTQAEHLMEKAR